MTNVLILLTLPEDVRVQYRDRLRARFPQLKVDLVDHHAKVDPFMPDADVLITFGPMLVDRVFQLAARLKWVQALGTGVDNLIDLPSLPKDAIVTNLHGIHGPPLSEAAFGAMLLLSRRMHSSVRAQDKREWARWPSTLLNGKTVGVFGVGAIAADLAPRLKAFNMRTVGITSAVRQVAGFDEMRSSADLENAVRDLDYLILLTPLTAATRGIVDAKVLAAMKPTAFLVNLARGGVVDEAALIDTLRAQRIAGAAVDVFVQEPLPQDSPFWALDNIFITPHLGGFNDQYVDHAMPVIEHNMAAFLAGTAPAGMRNVVKRA
jgi:phosphoglycerate dehydrogenase-like enzyme